MRALLIFTLVCAACSSTEARARNAAEGATQALELKACRDDAAKLDGGDRFGPYTACADAVDAKHGRKP
jgi:hypothetical protein